MSAGLYALNAAFRDFGVGERFCVDWRPTRAARGALLLLPPFGEELNKSRRAMACAAREFATNGWFVRLVDVFGTGDSPGDFADATWARWVADYRAAANDLAHETGLKVSYWGIRIGAVIALDVAAPDATLIFWQPVLSGEQQLTQLLRLRVTQQSLSGSGQALTTKQLRSMLEGGQPLEIGGYELNPSLVLPMAERRIDAFDGWKGAIDWLDTGPEPRIELPPATGRTLELLRERGVAVEYDHVVGQPFWATVEIERADGLARRSLDMLRAVAQ